MKRPAPITTLVLSLAAKNKRLQGTCLRQNAMLHKLTVEHDRTVAALERMNDAQAMTIEQLMRDFEVLALMAKDRPTALAFVRDSRAIARLEETA